MIEADANRALPTIDIIWLPDAAVKEARERIRMAFKNCDIQLPPKKIVINLAPSDVKKEWTRFDLAMASAILSLTMSCTPEWEDFLSAWLFFWELWLDASVRRVSWLLPCVLSAVTHWKNIFVVPKDNMHELKYIPNITLYPLTNFIQLVHFLSWAKELDCLQTWSEMPLPITFSNKKWRILFSDIKWHILPKRALTIAAAWMHNVLLIWPPWSWKTMLSKALHSVLPPLWFDEVLEVSQLYSLVWKLSEEQPLILKRPYRTVHHTASKVSIVGGGRLLTPWEISLSHHGVLFFDELAEFPREVLEVLRQPLEDKVITISRAQWSVSYPASFMFVATMNPCKCWYYKDEEKPCICSLNDIKRYQSKISGPLLDRFDIILEVPRETIDVILHRGSDTLSNSESKLIEKAWNMQTKRYSQTSASLNAHISWADVQKYISLDNTVETFLKKAIKQLSLSPRVMHRIIKVARTIADIWWEDMITTNHIAEALQYRAKSMLVNT